MKRLKSAGRKRVGAKRPYALIGRNPDGLKGRDVSELAWELGLSRATTYRMIRLFRAGGTVASLMDRTRGRRPGFANVRQFLIDNASAFIKEYRIDGIRYDAVRVISDNRPAGAELCQDITSTVRFIRPSAIQIAEYWDRDRAFPVTPTPAGLGFDATLGDAFRDAVRGLLTQAAGGAGAQLELDPVAAALDLPAGYDAAWRLVQCLENHDLTYLGHDGAARVAMLADPAERQSWHARSRSRAAAALLFAAPGIPVLFMGQEILEDKLWCDDEKNHPGHLIWWDGLATEPTMADYRRFMSDLIALRRRQPALNADGVRASRVNDFDRLIVVHRWVADGRGQDVVAVVSFDEQPKYDYRVGLPRDGEWIELFNTDITTAFPILSRSATGESSTRTARRSTASRSRPRSPSRQTAHSFFGPRTRRSRQVRAAQ